MSDTPNGPGWWQASDGKWYPPESHPNYRPLLLPPPVATLPPRAPSYVPSGPPPVVLPKRKALWKRWWFVVPALLVTVVVIAAVASPKKADPSTGTAKPNSTGSGATAGSQLPAAEETQPATVATELQSTLSPAQQNAVRSAESYLEFMSFSRQGLIDQLSSEFGEKFALADATVAVDSLDIDWNVQAVGSAQRYLEISGFSCQGLIDQLSSAYGDQFTVEQAKYGATQAGIC